MFNYGRLNVKPALLFIIEVHSISSLPPPPNWPWSLSIPSFLARTVVSPSLPMPDTLLGPQMGGATLAFAFSFADMEGRKRGKEKIL